MCGNLLCLHQPNYGDRLDKLNLINFMFHCILCEVCNLFEGMCLIKCMLKSLHCKMFAQMLDFRVFTPHDVLCL